MLMGFNRFIKKPSLTKMWESAKVLTETITEKDKNKTWKVIKHSYRHTYGEEQWKAVTPSIGDHIKVRRFGYTHHGIYISDKEVIHFTGMNNDNIKNWKDNKVLSTSLKHFLNDGNLLVRQYTLYEERELRSPIEIMLTAREFNNKDGYNLFSNNCEHFCNVCTFNKKYSKQVNRWTEALEDFFLPIRF